MASLDLRRLRLLVELDRLGSMRAVADAVQLTTSTVSHQLAVLAGEVGAALLEPDGRRVRLTPAGRRLVAHGIDILAAVDAAVRDLVDSDDPQGTVRVGGFGTAIQRGLLPVVEELSRSGSRIHILISECEPAEAHHLLLADRLDLGLSYDYSLAPANLPEQLVARTIWATPWGLGVPAADGPLATGTPAAETLSRFADRDWIVNSRNSADEEVLDRLAALAGVTLQVTHRIDSLDLVAELIARGRGVGLLPLDRPTPDDVTVLPLRDPELLLRACAVYRGGHDRWPPLRAVIDLISGSAR